jgi:hypothetical protein
MRPDVRTDARTESALFRHRNNADCADVVIVPT